MEKAEVLERVAHRSSDNLLVVNSDALAELMPAREAIKIIDLAMRELSAGQVTAPERWAMKVGGRGHMGLMPGVVAGAERFGVKVVSLFPDRVVNHRGFMLLFDSRTGVPLCVVDSRSLTGLRTAAASAVATDALARPDARRLALIGSGEQARWHARVLPLVRPIDEIVIWSRNPATAAILAEDLSRDFDGRVELAEGVKAAVMDADIVCTLTGAEQPLLEGVWLRPGQHVNLVGGSTLNQREADDETIARARLIVDCRAHALSQCGELRHAMNSGRVDPGHIVGEIGDVLDGRVVGRPDDQSITLYKSLGHAVQDLRIADALIDRQNAVTPAIQINW